MLFVAVMQCVSIAVGLVLFICINLLLYYFYLFVFVFLKKIVDVIIIVRVIAVYHIRIVLTILIGYNIKFGKFFQWFIVSIIFSAIKLSKNVGINKVTINIAGPINILASKIVVHIVFSAQYTDFAIIKFMATHQIMIVII